MALKFVAMKSWCSISFILIFIAVSVRGNCLVINCRESLILVGDRCCTPESVVRDQSRCCDIGTVPVGNRCRRRTRRSAESEGCYGSNKVYIDQAYLDRPGSVWQCDRNQVLDENMQCRSEIWEPNSGPWETHHYQLGGRRIVIEMRRSDYSVKYRYLGIDGNRK